MSPFLQVSLLLAIILICAKLAGYISNRLGQPSVLGELLVGLLLGPSVINLTHLGFVTHTESAEIIHLFGELGVLLLMFLAGLELHLSELAKNTRVSAYAGILGVLLPVGLGWLGGNFLGYTPAQSLFLGLTLGATSVSISAQTLIEMGQLRTRVGLGLLGAAVFDDILVILLLSIGLALLDGGSGVIPILLIIGRMVLFLMLSLGIGVWLLPRLVRRVSRLPISFGGVTFAVVVMLLYGIGSEWVGNMAAITGAFVAGLMFARTPEKNQIDSGLRALAYAFFVPIFFVNIGLSIDLRQVGVGILWALVLLSVIAILGKIIGSGLGARLGGLPLRESVQIGVGMVSRGEVGLIVAQVGLTNGMISPQIFSAIIGVVLVTTLVTPPLLRISFRKTHPKEEVPDINHPEVEKELG